MRYTRLAVESNGRTFKLQFHPRLTVVTGVGPGTRESLVRELIGVLGTNRAGTHVELVDDSGRRITIFRPSDGTARVIDMASGHDVSAEFTNEAGVVDLLTPEGLDVAEARRWMRLGSTDLATTTRSQLVVSRLAELDQSELWSAATRVRLAEELLNEHDLHADPREDVSIVQKVEHSRDVLESAVERAEKSRTLAVQVGAVCVALAALVALVSSTAALIALLIATTVVAGAFYLRHQVTLATSALDAALGAAGASSYLDFHMNRIDTYLSSEQHRRQRAAASDDARDAAARWHALAGDVTVEWVFAHRDAIVAAAHLRSHPREAPAAHSQPGSALPALVDGEDAGELVEALLHRLTRVRRLGGTDESFPLLLDEPFANLDPSSKPALLEVLVKHAGDPQVILLTNDEDVVAWARLEALTGAVSLVGPGAGTSRAPSVGRNSAGHDHTAGTVGT